MNLMDLFIRIGLDDQASKELATVTEKLGSGVKKAAKVATAAIAAASTAIVGFAASSVKAGQDFDASMSQVAATMGKTVDEITDLRDFAQEMGRTTAFSATEAADALNYMALAGYDAEKSMSMLPTVLNLAAAGSIDLAYASDMITDSQSALSLSTEETVRLVDEMAKTASRSNTSVAQLGEAILTVGGTAQYMAGGTEQINKVLGIMADNGIKGSEAGTHLRNMLLSLSAPTENATAVLEELNVDIFDAEGKMRDFAEVFPELNKAMEDLTEEEKLQNISELFNARDIASATALLETSEKRWSELANEIENASGAAEKMAGTQLDNLAGDITLFKSALEGAQITISDELTPSLRGLVQFGSGSISSLTESFKKGGFAGAMETFGGIVSDFLGMVVEEIPNVAKSAVNLLKSFISGILDNSKMISDSAVDLVMTLVTGILTMLPDILQLGLNLVLNLVTGIKDAVPELTSTIFDVVIKLAKMITDPNTLVSIIDAAFQLILALVDGIIAALPDLVEAAPVIIQNLVEAISQALPMLWNAAIELILALTSYLYDPRNQAQVINAGIDIVFALVKGILTVISKMPETAMTLLNGLLNLIHEKLGVLRESGVDILKSIADGFLDNVDDAIKWGGDLIDNFIAGIKQKWNELKSAVSDVAQSIKDLIGFSEPKKGPLSNFHTYAPDMMDLFMEGIDEKNGELTAKIQKTFDFGTIGEISGESADMMGVENLLAQILTAIKSGGGLGINSISEGLDRLQARQNAAIGVR